MSLDFDSARQPNPHFTEEHHAWREALRRFIDSEVMPYADAWDEAGEIPTELWPKAAAVGLLGLGYPEQFGGTPADSWYSWIVNEELSRVGAGGISASLMVHGIGLPPVLNWGPDVMDSNDLEKERGITILSKNTGLNEIRNNSSMILKTTCLCSISQSE